MATLEYAADFGTDTKYTLLEIPPELADAIEAGTELGFAGADEDTMVLCTDSTTYSIKVATTSNTLYITDAATSSGASLVFGEGDAISIIGAASSVLEVVPDAPRLERMAVLLHAVPFAGVIERVDDTVSGTAWETFVKEVQASQAELMTALETMNAFEYEGRWQVMEERYAADKLTLILTSAIAEGWSLDHLDVATVTASLQGHDCPEVIVATLLRQYGTAVKDGEGNGTVYNLDVDRICRFEAVKLLRGSARWPVPTFMDEWAGAVPDSMQPSVKFSQLHGVALVCETGAEGTEMEVVYFPASELPMDHKKRMATLFNFRPVWTGAEISPYIQGIAVGGLTVEKILFKHARSFAGEGGVRMYNKR